MPVAVKLSRKFYETLGDEITNELVDVLNQVDATYRTELKELNELNFTRFDGKLDQRVAELEARIAESEARLARQISEFERAALRWMFGFWAPTAVAVIGLLLKG